MRTVLSSLIILVFYAIRINAQAVTLDPTFNSTGIFSLEPGNSVYSTSSLLQPDGRLLLCGWTYEDDQEIDVLVIRLMPDGTLDPSFGSEGIAQLTYNKFSVKPYGMALQTDGRIIITGSKSNPHTPYEFDFATLRLNSDGSVDKSFGFNGWIIDDLGTDEEFASVLAIQPDGKILSAGRIDVLGHSDFLMVRYLPDGSRDSLFGDAGIVQTTFLDTWLTTDEVYAIAIFPNGQILLGGVASRTKFGLARYHPNGCIDSTFGEHGLVIREVGTFRMGVINNIQITEDGGFLAGGQIRHEIPWESHYTILRFLPDGNLNPQFGNNGISNITLGEETRIGGMELMLNESMLMGGTLREGEISQDDWLLARLSSNGKLDPTFDADGYATHMIGVGFSIVNSILVQSDGKIILLGQTEGNSKITAARFHIEESSGIDDFNHNVNFQIYPNPTNGTFQIDLGNKQFSDSQICVYSAFGKPVFNKSITEFENELEIAVGNIESGTYIVKIWNEKYCQAQKLIIQN